MKELDAFDSRFQANILTQLLDENNIPYVVQANDAGGMFPTNVEFSEVKVFVSEEDYEKALKIIHD